MADRFDASLVPNLGPVALTWNEFCEVWWQRVGYSLNEELARNGQFDEWVEEIWATELGLKEWRFDDKRHHIKDIATMMHF
jgi:hypothetical protein